MAKGAPLRVTISPDLMSGLEAESDRLQVPLRDVVEARLRDSFDKSVGKELLLLRVDDGLLAWLRAIDRLRFFGISFNDCVVSLLRESLIRTSDHDAWFPHVADQLEEPYGSYVRATPRYRRLKEALERDRDSGRSVWPFSQAERKD